MEEQIRKMLFRDRSLIIICIFFLWVVLISTISVVSGLAPMTSVRILASIVGVVVGVSVTSALIAVLAHLKKHRNELYSEDIMWSQLVKRTN
jgi:membrane associated rhomboid family serine protease